MAYETAITIKKALDKIKKRQYVLPSIQREFVWDTNQIEMLFDSLMRDYPISTFLFWRVDKNKIKDFQFYEFLKNYHEKDCKHNVKIELTDEEDIIALLDGQQRLTSLFVALCGTFAKKIPYCGWKNPAAFPKKKLYLNLLKPSDDLEPEFDFKFLTKDEAKHTNEYFWFECGKILEISDMSKTSMFLMKNKLMDTSIYSEKQSEFAINTLNEFFNVIHQKGTISYYLEEGEELDKVLQIFIRINSGGTKLSYSDLLLSIATAQWKEKDAREIIHEFVDEINEIGDGFSFNKDFVLKSCLVLADFRDVKFKVDNFNKENMSIIENNWDKTSSAVRTAIGLVAKFGFNRDNLAATNSIIPIAYFIYKNEFDNKIIHSSAREDDRKLIKEWLARVLLKGTFGGQPDSIYPVMRTLIKDHLGEFPLREIIKHYRGSRKSISFTEDDIESLLDLQYGKAKTHCALTILYSALNHNFKYHQDHIHPKSLFKKKSLKDAGISIEDIDDYQEVMNCLSNLQLLEATTNIEKNNTPFEQWLKEKYSSKEDRNAFLLQNHISVDQSLSINDFLEFMACRRTILEKELRTIFNVTETEDKIIFGQ